MKFHKWIRNVKPNNTVRQAAVRSLKARLKAVQHFLPLAANKAEEDVEYVHSLRVFTRRAGAAMRMFEKFSPAKRAAWISEQLKRIRNAAGNARDCDVLLQRYANDPHISPASPLLQILREQRCDAQREILSVFEESKADDLLDRRIDAFLRRVKRREGKSSGSKRFGGWAKKKLRRVVKNFFAVVPADPHDLQALHQFRIAGKKLRYDMELLAGAFPARFRKQLYRQLAELQEKLGRINDHVVAQCRLRDWIEASQTGDENQHLQILVQQETAALETALADFLVWWSPQRVETLRAGFDHFISPKSGR